MDAYASVGMPVIYHHWSFGKQFLSTEKSYKRGQMGLAYEIVINSNPCIAYLMEENSLTMQALVIAHAAYGHNSFFKGNYLFRTWTDADAIIDYMVFAKNYIAECEERHGVDAVEDAARLLPRAAELRRGPLQPPAQAVAGAGETRAARSASTTLQSQVNDCGAPCRAATGRGQRRGSGPALPARAAGEPAVLHREERAAAGTLAARDGAHRAQDLAVLLSAAPDPGDERGLGHLLALHHAQHAVRRGPARRRLHDGVAARPYQRGVTSRPSATAPTAASIRMRWALRCSPTSGASARSRPRKTARWFPDIAGSDWLQDARLRDAQFQGRELHRPVPVAQADPRLPLLRHQRRSRTKPSSKSPPSTTTAATASVREPLSRQYNLNNREPNIQVWSVNLRDDRSLTLRHTQHNAGR